MASIERAEQAFAANLRSVQELVDFDRTVLDTAISNIERLWHDLADRPSHANRVENTLQMPHNIRQHDSMRSHYAIIYNQCIVLLVSHFASVLHEIFVAAAPARLADVPEKDAEEEEMRFSLAELREREYEFKEAIGEVLIVKRNISFQDMQSTVRAFKTYLGVDIATDEHAHNIILAQAARHVIVHSGAIADAKFMRQVSAAHLRQIKSDVVERGQLAFTPAEVERVATSMRTLVGHVVGELRGSWHRGVTSTRCCKRTRGFVNGRSRW